MKKERRGLDGRLCYGQRREDSPQILLSRINRGQDLDIEPILRALLDLRPVAVKCFINKIKRYRRIFTRYEKPARRYMGSLHLVRGFHLASVKCQRTFYKALIQNTAHETQTGCDVALRRGLVR
jgi:hypothetical protein